MEEEKTEQEFLNTSPNYLFSITKQKEEMEEDCALYKICIYQRKIYGELPDLIFSEEVGEFELLHMGDGDKFFLNLRLGIEKKISNTDSLMDWANGE